MKKELDEIKIYFNLSKIDKMKTTYHQIPQKWYLDKRKEVYTLIEEFGKNYQFSKHSLYASMLFCDKILAYIEEINSKELELSIIVCCLLASKFVENDTYEINYNELISFSKNNTFTIEEIYLKEISIIKKLNYYLSFPSVYEFIQYLNVIGVFYRDEITNPISLSEDIQEITLKIILSPISLKYPNEVIAMNIIRIVRKKYKLKEEYMKKILKKFKFEYDKLYENCYNEIYYLIFGEKEKIQKKRLSFEDEIENEEKIEIQRRKTQAKTTKRARGSIKFEVPKEFKKNIQIMHWSNSSASSSSSSSSFLSSSSSSSFSLKDEKKEEEKEIQKKISLKKNKEKKKKVIVQINETKNEYYEETPTSIKLSSVKVKFNKEKQRKIKPVNRDKINRPFSGKRIRLKSSSDEEDDNNNNNIVKIEKKKSISSKGFKTPKFKDYI